MAQNIQTPPADAAKENKTKRKVTYTPVRTVSGSELREMAGDGSGVLENEWNDPSVRTFTEDGFKGVYPVQPPEKYHTDEDLEEAMPTGNAAGIGANMVFSGGAIPPLVARELYKNETSRAGNTSGRYARMKEERAWRDNEAKYAVDSAIADGFKPDGTSMRNIQEKYVASYYYTSKGRDRYNKIKEETQRLKEYLTPYIEQETAGNPLYQKAVADYRAGKISMEQLAEMQEMLRRESPSYKKAAEWSMQQNRQYAREASDYFSPYIEKEMVPFLEQGLDKSISDFRSLQGERPDEFTGVADNLLNKAEKLRDAARNGGFLTGMGDTASDWNFWSLGIADLYRAKNIREIADKADKALREGADVEFTPEELNTLQAYAIYQQALNLYSEKVPLSYTMGQVTAEMIPFATSIALGQGLVKLTTKGISAVAKKAATREVAQAVSQALGKSKLLNSRFAQGFRQGAGFGGETTGVAGVAGNMLGGMTRGTGEALTVGAPRTWAEKNERMTGQADIDVTDSGQPLITGFSGRESGGEAFAHALAGNAIEYQSERAGQLIDRLGGALKARLPKDLQLSMGSLGDYIKSITPKSLKRFYKSPYYKAFKDNIQLQGVWSEYGEEELANWERVLLGLDEPDVLLDNEQRVETFLSLLPAQLMMGAGAGVYSAGRYRQASARLDKLMKEMKASDPELYEKYGKVRGEMDGFDVKAVTGLLSSIDRDGKLDANQKTEVKRAALAEYYTKMLKSAQEAEIFGRADEEMKQAYEQAEALKERGSGNIVTADYEGRKVNITDDTGSDTVVIEYVDEDGKRVKRQVPRSAVGNAATVPVADVVNSKADEITARVKTEMQELEHPGVAAPEPGMRLVHNGENYAVTSISPDGVVIMREDEEGNNSLPEVISLDTYYAEKQAEIDAQEQQPQSGENGEAAQETASPAEEEPAPVSGGGAVQEETALGRMPKDEQGQPLYEQADAETAWDAIMEQAGGDEAMAQEVANEIVSEQEKALKAAEKELKKVQDGKPQQRKGDAPLTVEARIAAKQAAREQTSRAQAGVDEARKRLEAWRKIAGEAERRRQAIEAERRQEEQEAARLRGIQEEQERAEREEAERIRREALNGVPDFIEDRPQDARARGYRRVNGNRVDRQEPIQARRGGEVQVKFDDNNIPTGHTALIEASQLQPSHTDGRRNPLHFIDEAQPKERNDEASVMSARKIAANIRPEEITSSVTAYTGAPTVNSRGEVIQGNNRSAALREMWAEHPEQAAKYRQYLADHAADFGLTPEDVEAMQQPVLVNMLDVTDDAAITLGQFVAQDTESGGTERIKPKNMVQKMGDDMRIFAGKLLASADEEMSFAELVDRNGADVLKWMQQKGYITPTQYKSAFDSKGNLTAEAKNDLKGVMYQSIFQNGSTHLEEMFNTLPAKAQKAILATAYRDYDSPNTERMIEEIQDSISAYHALSQDPAFAGARNYKEARIAAEAWKRQYAFDDATGESYLPSERYSNFALLLATMYKGQTQTFIQNTLGHIYDLVQGTQEADLFNQPDNTPRTLVQAINETLGNLREELLLNENFTYNGQRRSNVLAGGSEAGQRGRQGSDGNASSGGRAENGSRQADNSRRTETDSGLSRRDGTQEAGDIRQPAPMDEKARRASIRLNGEQCDILLAQMREQAEVAPDVELNPTTWNERFGENGIIITPLGEVKMGENQIAKFFAKGREKEFGMVAPTLSDPDIIIEKKAPASNAERDTKLLFIKTFIKADGSRYVNFESVTVQKDGMEVSISSHEVDAKVVKKEMQNGNILHLRIELPFSSEWYLTETPTQERPDLVPTSDKKKNVEQNAELPASATTTQDKPFVQTGVNDGSKPADTHSDNQRSGNKDKKTSAETSQERQKTDSNLSEAFKQQMNIRIGQLSKFIQTKDGKLKKKYESLRKTPFFAIFDSGNIYEGPVAIAKTPREALNVAFNYDIGDFDVLYVDFRTKSLDMDLLSIYDVPGFRGDVYDENGAYKDEAKNLLVERISRLGKRQEADGKKRGRKQIEKAIGMLREGLASGDFGTVRRALGMYWTNQYHGAEITEEEAAFVDGVLDNYRQQGIEIINPLGTRYGEGMKVVADFRTDDTLKPGENRIVGVREPQVNTDGVMSHSASIIVAISPVAEESPADVQGNADENIRRAESEVERNPSEAQKEAGNYRKGHVRVDGYDITIEQPKGSVRSGTDADGKRWENVMNNTYGYMRGTEGVDGDHIDVFLSDNPESGNVYVIDQRDPKTGEFDEHKVMYGFGSMEEARDAYLKNYTPGWQGLGTITEVSKEEFRKWIGSSKRKTKPFAEYRSVKKEAGQNEDVRQSRDVSSPLSAEEAAIRDAIVERLRESGIEVITDAEAGQRVLDEANGRGEPVRTQAMLDGLKKASDFILSALGGKTKQRKARIEIPERANRLAEEAIGHPIKSHAININELVHIKKRHGENGTANDANSIPLRDEDIALMPYIMAAPTRVIKGSMAVNGTESVRYEKDLDNGVVVVVEREGRFDVEDMENITMWAKKKPATNVTVAEKASHSTSETIVISETDSAKIRKDAEDAIHGDEKVREHRVYHGSGADFEAFDHSHMGEGEGAQAYGWGSYVTEVEGIGRTYAVNLARRVNHITYDGENLGDVLDNEYLFDETWRNWKLTLLYAETANDLKYLIRNLLFVPKGKNIRERKKNFERQKKELLAAIDNGRIKVEANNRHLYTVEIPDDTGENYLEWEKDYGWNDIDRFARRSGGEVDSGDLGVGLEDDGNAAASGASIVKSLEETFGEKEASEILSKCGFTGISYPAQATTGGRKDGARNYVIFDEKDLRITDHVRFFRTPGGEAYGFTAGGKIYIDPRVATADTPIHEYAHLWAGALRQANPKEWNNIVELMRGTPAWDEVKRLYPELESDEEIADEALAMYSGRRGAERLREAARRAWNESADLGVKAAAARAMGRVRDALRRFWQNVADLLHFRYTSAEEVADRVMRDLMEGVNPNRIKSATDNTGAFSAGNDDIRYSRAEEEDANRRFNEELDKWESGGMSANEYVTVGNPIGVLRHFTPDLPIILRQKVLSKCRKKHGLSASDMRNLPAALAEPIFIFKSSDNTIGVLTGLVSDSGENIFVAIELDANKQMGHQMLEVNDILTIHGRETENIINPIKENNTLKWVDKEKGLNWLSSAKSNSQAVTNKALDTATNIVKDFENPSLEDENLFRIGETKRIGGESLFGRRITFTRANPTVTLNAMKRWVLKNADLKEYDVSRTGSRYLSFTHNSVDYKIRSANHTKAYDGVRPESSGLSVSVEDRIYGVEIDLAENEMVKEDILRIIEDTDRLNDTGLNLQNTVESGVLPDEMVSADRELTDAVIREVREMAEWRLDSARTKAESEYEREHPLEDYKADNGIMILNRYFYGRVSYEVKFPDGWRGKTKQPRADAIQEYEDSDAHRRNMEQASGMNVYVDGMTKAQAETLRKIDGLANRLEQERMAGAVREMAERLHLDDVEIVTDASTLTGRRARAKGFYSPRTGKISIVIPNHASEADAVQTLLHEAVAHKGLRQLFGEHFDTFLWNVYRNADRDVRERINALASDKGWDFPTATEEYLASLAENTDFENAQRSGWWEKIKRLFIDMLHKMGLDRFSGVTLSDNELRYILWRSYENLREPGAERSITGVAADVVKQAELKVGNYAEEATGGNMAAEENDDNLMYRFIGERGASRLDAEEEATTRLDNLDLARRMEQAYNDRKARIEKLRGAKPVKIKGNEIEPSDDPKQYKKNALEYGKKLQGEYTNKDTGNVIQLQRGRKNGGLKEVLQHDINDDAHIQSIAAIPQIIEDSIYIDSAANNDTKKNPDVSRYHYYVCGLKIGNIDYTVRMVEAEEKDGSRYYDHKLTHIEKGKLIDELTLVNHSSPTELSSTPGSGDAIRNRPTDRGETPKSPVSGIKDKRLASILQTNDDENARKIKSATGWEHGADGKWRYETPDIKYTPVKNIEEGKFYQLSDFVNDKDLFNAYPELKFVKVVFGYEPAGMYGGYWDIRENLIFINTAHNTSNHYKNTFVHEIQHAIQDIEGFAPGGDRSLAYEYYIKDGEYLGNFNKNELNELYELRRMAERLVDEGKYKRIGNAINHVLKTAKENGYYLKWVVDDYDKTPYYVLQEYTSAELKKARDLNDEKFYMSISGEVEARNAEKRMGMSENKRRNTLAEETEDVAREDQIFLEKTLGDTKRGKSLSIFEDRNGAAEDGTRDTPLSSPTVHAWDRLAQSLKFQLRETAVDYLTAIDKFQDLIAKHSGRKIESFENAYDWMTFLSSRNRVEMDMFDSSVVRPLNNAILKLTREKRRRGKWKWDEGALRELVMYVEAKHGTDRNRQMAVEEYVENFKMESLEFFEKSGIGFDKESYRKELGEIKREAGEKAYAESYEKALEKLRADSVPEEEAKEKASKAAKRSKEKAALKASEKFRERRREELAEQYREKVMAAWTAEKKRINSQNISWIEKQRQLDAAAARIGADIEQDYSGLSSIFGDTEQYPGGWREESLIYAADYEAVHDSADIASLWNAIDAATGFALRKQYETGLVSREYVDRQRERFEHYIPLRGFSDETAGDVYSYIGHDFYPGGNPVKTAHGRMSEAGNPFGSILNIAYSSISAGNKNMAKTALYALVRNHDTDGLAVVNRAWMVRYDKLKEMPELSDVVTMPTFEAGEETPKWVEAVPRIPEAATSDDITRIMSKFEDVMTEYRKNDFTKPIRKNNKTAYRTLNKERSEHDIPLFIAGEKYVITVTGNPRPAQAMNGLLNPDVNEDALSELGKRVQRFMAGAFTGKNAAFSIANLFRDTIYANNQMFIRENPAYWLKFTRNQRLGFGDFISMMRRLKKFREGTLGNSKDDRLFQEFMLNGGATGYTFVNTQEEYARELAGKLDELSRKTPERFSPIGLIKLFFDAVQFAGESAELVNRFAAYKTSREMGRTMGRSIRDAKEITVNFNRKGAGRKSADKNKSWYSPVNMASAVSQYGRCSILFWNANMQGKYRFYKNMTEHPVKTSVTLIANNMALAAVVLPLLNNVALPMLYELMGLGDDGDDENYFNVLTDWERTHNICIRLPKSNWLKIPISPDFVSWFSMGDAIGGQVSGEREMSAKDFITAVIDAVSPLSMNWSYEGSQMLLNFAPTVTQPLLQNAMNVNFMGNPLKKTPYNSKQGFKPEYQMVYSSASPTLVELSRLSNRILGGTDLKTSGWADWNPAELQNLISGYTGGYGTTFLSASDWIVGTAKGEKQAVTFSRMPLVSRFAISGNKDVKLSRVNSRFYDVKNFVDEFEYDLKSYEDAIELAQKEKDAFKTAEYVAKREELIKSERAGRYQLLKGYVKAAKDCEDYLEELPEDEVTRNFLYNLKQEAINLLYGEYKKKE